MFLKWIAKFLDFLEDYELVKDEIEYLPGEKEKAVGIGHRLSTRKRIIYRKAVEVWTLRKSRV